MYPVIGENAQMLSSPRALIYPSQTANESHNIILYIIGIPYQNASLYTLSIELRNNCNEYAFSPVAI